MAKTKNVEEKGWSFWIIVVIAVILVLVALYYFNKNKYEPNVDFIWEDYPEEIETSPVEKTPSKKKYVHEEMCREILESIYNVPFKKCKPPFLKSPKTGRLLEFDGYNEDLKIAFEYNGHQHYEYPNTYHRSEEQFRRQLYNDRIKREICDRLGIYLITIPYHIKDKDLRLFIISRLPRDQLESLESVSVSEI